jgi:asparagine synthase (glutamine-hydrolysing)
VGVLVALEVWYGHLYRSIFEAHFPGDAAASCVPSGPSIACSKPTALRWDNSFAEGADPSGRAVLDVHRGAGEPVGE